MSKIKKSELKNELENLKNQLSVVTDRLLRLEEKTAKQSDSLHLPLFKELSHRCNQCNNDLSKAQACMSVNCPYSYTVSFNGY